MKLIVVDPLLPREAYPKKKLNIQFEPPIPYTAAAAAKSERPTDEDLKALEQCSISLNYSGPIISGNVILKGTQHPLLGMSIYC